MHQPLDFATATDHYLLLKTTADVMALVNAKYSDIDLPQLQTTILRGQSIVSGSFADRFEIFPGSSEGAAHFIKVHHIILFATAHA